MRSEIDSVIKKMHINRDARDLRYKQTDKVLKVIFVISIIIIISLRLTGVIN